MHYLPSLAGLPALLFTCLPAFSHQNEALNKGGQVFVERHPDLKVRICHGNTLTAAVVVKELQPDCKEVFMTGATSKLGRAIGLYLANKGVRVMMMTNSEERFRKIQVELPVEKQPYLVQVESAAAAKHCKTWIAGKWLTEKEQSYAPAGTHFHQFVVPPIEEYRKDCTYGLITQIYLPRDVKNLNFCLVSVMQQQGGAVGVGVGTAVSGNPQTRKELKELSRTTVT